jgi:Mycotoxin biosynthesis protein UstYa
MVSIQTESHDELSSQKAEGNIGFPYEKLAVINKSAEHHRWWRLPPPNDNQVIAFPESKSNSSHITDWKNPITDSSPVTHQMHCVALLWHFAYREDWDYHMTEVVLKLHVNHCYLTLLTMMKCEADITPVLFQKDISGLGAWRTRDCPHRCKKFDRLAEWERKHKICRSNCMYGDVL